MQGKAKTINWIQFLIAKKKPEAKGQDVREIWKLKETGQ